jgi:dCTP deaminase
MSENWLPGVLSRDQVLWLSREGYIEGIEDESAVDHSAVDLHVTETAWRLTEGSVKPFGDRYLRQIKKDGLVEELTLLDGAFLLRKKTTYLFRIRERLHLQQLNRNLYGQATAKSSVGRVDVLARLIVDGMLDYEMFTPDEVQKGSGEMYVEVTPITFDVLVRPGVALTQLRFFLGAPHDSEMKDAELYKTCLTGTVKVNGTLSVDLTPVEIGGLRVSAFATSVRESHDAIPLWVQQVKPRPWQYWRCLQPKPPDRLRIEKDQFYILRSKERIALPAGVAVYCRANDETIGEMRIHYAGFVHPLFGQARSDGNRGTPLIFEVRGHDVNVSLRDGERMARLTFYRMSQDAAGEKSAYEQQTLNLSKFFGDWPARLKNADGDGAVEPQEEP